MEPGRPGEPLGILAGGGSLPRIVADAALQAGWSPLVVRIGDGVLDDWTGFDGEAFAWGRSGDAIAYLKRRQVRRVVFCGTVTKRPDFRSLIPSLRTLVRLPSAIRMVRGGDDRLLRAVSRYLERDGFAMLAVQEIVPELLAPAGLLSRRAPGEDEARAMAIALAAARRLGELDIGQAVAASAERVIALEAVEGTREMVARVGDLRRRGRITPSERCVLVKSVKPQQDARFDLPSIGAATIAEAAAAGISAIGVTAGRSLILGLEDVVAAADESGIALVGLVDEAEDEIR
ncbi:MAG TPA: UDP-2,3-diacylglucosamine diphosphatase LpxI [Aurantimonas sp.]|nr:UDP-2,3-diacylglucosamine diphosphatase LpxI [Aurantimonas sp.]